MKTEETPPTSGETAVDVQPSAETEPSSSDDQKGEGDGKPSQLITKNTYVH